MKATVLSLELLFGNYYQFIVFRPKCKQSGLAMTQYTLRAVKSGGMKMRTDKLLGKVGKLPSALNTETDITYIHEMHVVERWPLDNLK